MRKNKILEIKMRNKRLCALCGVFCPRLFSVTTGTSTGLNKALSNSCHKSLLLHLMHKGMALSGGSHKECKKDQSTT